jgi:hypothetical protein
MRPDEYAKDSFCHEVGEVIDAVEYLLKDIQQAEKAADVYVGISGQGPPVLDKLKVELLRTMATAKEVLAETKCPNYKEVY